MASVSGLPVSFWEDVSGFLPEGAGSVQLNKRVTSKLQAQPFGK